MIRLKHVTAAAAVSVGVIAGGASSAATITNWNLSNVDPGPDVAVAPEGGVSTIYQGAVGTESNGQIAYTPPEAFSPGLIALNDPYSGGQGTFDGCIRADAGGAECATGFQTGNRFKLQLTDDGSVDLVFDIDPNAAGTQGGTDGNGDFLTAGVNTYQVFGRAVNLTTKGLESFVVELGYGVGDNFTASTATDGLSFARNLELGPKDLEAFSQYPFGLFGDAPTQNATLDGFYDNARSGFDVAFVGDDRLESTGFYGGIRTDENGDDVASDGQDYEERFGSWLSREMAPAGLLWDNDNDEATDALVMAWFNDGLGENGEWEALRTIGLDENGNTTMMAESILTDPLRFETRAEMSAYFFDLFDVELAFEENIEDIANLNLNFGIALGESFTGWFDQVAGVQNNNFTLRLTSYAAPIAPVPLPASVVFLLAAIGSLGAVRRRKRAAAA